MVRQPVSARTYKVTPCEYIKQSRATQLKQVQRGADGVSAVHSVAQGTSRAVTGPRS